MKKLFLLLVAAMMAATVSFAQNKLVAVLSHGDQPKMFYGPSALIDAVNEAENGDVVTLSGGKFECANFTKAISVKGTGVNSENPTIIGYTSFYEYNRHNTIAIPQSDNYHFSMEGVIVNLYYINGGDKLKISGESSNLYFIKCKINTGISFDTSSSAKATFVDCNIIGFALNGSSTAKFSNCVITSYSNDTDTSSKADFFNCNLLGSSNNTKIKRSSFVNCILFSEINTFTNGTYSIPSETTAMNCLAIGTSFDNVLSAIDCFSIRQSETPSIFKAYSSSTDKWGTVYYFPSEPYELTDEAKAKYLGTDGKEMGIYGGQYPYNFTPLYPQITKLNVAKQATADNKLSVEIEVSAAE